ncbi:MAG: hypothetical protein ABIN57_03775 [Chitinophagaceae bacterium]
MKQPFILFFLCLLLSITSCYAQKIVQRTSDAKKLEIHKEQFIGKPLRVLLDQISPEIKSALGDPEATSAQRLNHIAFYFVDKKEFYRRDKKGEHPIIINVTLKRPNGKQYPALSSTETWNDEKTKTYGDMIIMRIHVSGKN